MEYEQFFQNDKCECVNYSTIRGMKDTIGYNKETLYNEM